MGFTEHGRSDGTRGGDVERWVGPTLDIKKITSREVKPIPQEFRPFTEQEIRILRNDGVVILDLAEAETIESQRKSGKMVGHVIDGGDRLLKAPSIIAQVAIYPDPGMFFIPDSGDKSLLEQEELAKKDGQELRKRLGLEDDSLDVIIPDQASTFTATILKYAAVTRREKGKAVWLFGREYRGVCGQYLYGRTRNPVNESGFDVVHVGGGGFGRFDIESLHRANGDPNVRVVRFIVAKKK